RLLGHAGAVHKLLRTSPRARFVRGIFLWLGLVLLLVGAAGPKWGWEPPRDTVKQPNVVVLLDLSRSMFAQQPSRLERAMRALHDLAETLQKRSGPRLALVVFATRAHLQIPLTQDYEHFRGVLREIEAGHRPDIYPNGNDQAISGTRFGAA